MNWKTENKPSYNFYQPATDQYSNNFDKVDRSITAQNVQKPVLKEADCKRCHIKIVTSNCNCPCCGEPVEV